LYIPWFSSVVVIVTSSCQFSVACPTISLFAVLIICIVPVVIVCPVFSSVTCTCIVVFWLLVLVMDAVVVLFSFTTSTMTAIVFALYNTDSG